MRVTTLSSALATGAILTFALFACEFALFACEGAGPAEQCASYGKSEAVKRPADPSGDGHSEKTDSIPRPAGQEGSGIANPADKHCVDAGYRLEYVHENGIPVDGLCINDKTGAKCRTWAYFRGECTLDSAPRPKVGHPLQ